MKKYYLSVALVLTLSTSILMTSCIGSFSLTNKVLGWNRQVGNKFVNELVFVAFWILPVYELSGLADLVVLNTIEFWSGNNPIEASTKVVDGKEAQYLVQCDKTGYTITNMPDKSTFRFDFDETENSWSFNNNGEKIKFMEYVDDTHVKMISPNGEFKTVELSENGVYAYEKMMKDYCQMAQK